LGAALINLRRQQALAGPSHHLPHTTATQLKKLGVPARAQIILGHSRLAMAVIARNLGARGNTLVRSDVTSGDRGRARSAEADVQDEMPRSQVEYPAAGPVHDGRQQDDGQDYHDHPEEEHDDAGDGIPGDRSRSSHGRQLPTAARLIQPVFK
jgi:hypothetical protein